jgi:hypothetical protein
MPPISSFFGRWLVYRILSSYLLAHFYLIKKSAKVLHYFDLDCGLLEFFDYQATNRFVARGKGVRALPGRGERGAGLVSPGLGRENRRGQALCGRGHQLGGRVNPLLIAKYPHILFHQTFNMIVCFL